MSAGSSGAVGPVSARYAAQIRELLYTQAVKSMAAEQESMRAAQAAQADRVKAAAKAEAPEPVKARIDIKPPADPAPTPAPASGMDDMPTPHLVDIHA